MVEDLFWRRGEERKTEGWNRGGIAEQSGGRKAPSSSVPSIPAETIASSRRNVMGQRLQCRELQHRHYLSDADRLQPLLASRTTAPYLLPANEGITVLRIVAIAFSLPRSLSSWSEKAFVLGVTCAGPRDGR